MNFDIPKPAAENEPRLPSLAEINAQIERLCGRENQEVLRTLEDEKGVYLLDVVVVDDQGDTSLYSYRRSGNYPETKTAVTVIDVAYFIGAVGDGMCVGGDVLSNYDETSAQWTDIK